MENTKTKKLYILAAFLLANFANLANSAFSFCNIQTNAQNRAEHFLKNNKSQVGQNNSAILDHIGDFTLTNHQSRSDTFITPKTGTVKALPAPKPVVSTSLNGVSKNIFKNNRLPDNYITKADAKALGWNRQKGNLAEVAPGKSIGGDIFLNKPVNGVRPLPEAPGRKWFEADLNYNQGYRNSERLIYSNDGKIFYSGDHYKTFQQLGN